MAVLCGVVLWLVHASMGFSYFASRSRLLSVLAPQRVVSMESLGNRLLGGDAGGVRWLWLLSLSASSMMRLLHHHWSARWLFCCCGLLAPNGWTPGYQCWWDDRWYNAEIWWYITYIAMDGQLLCRHEVRRFARSFTYFHFCFVVGRLLNLVCRLRHVPFCEYIAMIKIWLWNRCFFSLSLTIPEPNFSLVSRRDWCHCEKNLFGLASKPLTVAMN